MPKFFAWLSQKPRQHCCRILAIEKFHQFRDHLVRRFFHQPVAPAFDKDALDIGGHHLALLDSATSATGPTVRNILIAECTQDFL